MYTFNITYDIYAKHKFKVHKLIVLRFLVESGVNVLCD